jgi:hypothetical protein
MMSNGTLQSITEVREAASDLWRHGAPSHRVVRDVITRCSAEALRDMAEEWLIELLADKSRCLARATERAATTSPAPANPTTARRPRKGTAAWYAWIATDEGREAERARQYAREDAIAQSDFLKTMQGLVQEAAVSLHMTWTRELLDSTFVLPDGSTVSWGDATMDQHLARQSMFEKNAAANLEGATRHLKAVEQLRATGASTLREAVSQAAA